MLLVIRNSEYWLLIVAITFLQNCFSMGCSGSSLKMLLCSFIHSFHKKLNTSKCIEPLASYH